MGDWQEVASASFIAIIFAFMLAKLIAVIVSFRDGNLRVERGRSISSPPSAPLAREVDERPAEKHNSLPNDSDASAAEGSGVSSCGSDSRAESDEDVTAEEFLVREGIVARDQQHFVEGNAASESAPNSDNERQNTEDSGGGGKESQPKNVQEMESMDVGSSTIAEENMGTDCGKGGGNELSDSDDWEGVESTELEEAFGAAATAVVGMALEPAMKVSMDLQLQFYSLYKQATEGRCSTPQPSAYRLSARAKWHAWQKLGDMSSEEAMRQYVALFAELHPDWDLNPKKGSTKDGDKPEAPTGSSKRKGEMGPVFSMLVDPEGSGESGSYLNEMHKYAREGDAEGIAKLLECKIPIDQRDGDGRTALHWAVDRGRLETVKFLVSKGAMINSKDLEGQTALHYATICEWEEIAKYLLENGANPSAEDNDGVTPYSSCPAGWIWMTSSP
eukprot:c27037_g1_i2 orf=484-1821(-)